MGFIRGGLVFFVGILLLIFFLVMNVFLTLSLSLEYDNVKPKISSAVKDLAENEINLTDEIEENFVFAEIYCQNNTEFVFSQGEYVFEIPCTIVDEGPESVIDYGINQIIDEVYYKEYDCGFFECLRTEFPFFLISEQAKDSSQNRFYFFLFISLILIAVMFFLVERKSNLFIITGALLAVSSLPFMKLSTFLLFLDDSFLEFIPILISEASSVFIISFLIGIILIGFGVLLKLFSVKNFILDIFEKLKPKKKKNNV